ncbi:MAG: Gfo/Idh/MocA family oxidoreductase [Clostridia bacterium]|nr:Gfo/Idh/MocA family oxidoreductase [Clostridia bacterium]
MVRVGFIDYFLDEWHANNYPKLLDEHSQGRYQVTLAYGKIDNPHGGMTNEAWSEEYDISLAGSIEEVINNCDVIVVLSPDNPEMHEELCQLPLKSGKRVYIDKTFTNDAATARRLFELAESNNTPCWTSSALRFATELKDFDKNRISHIHTEGPGNFDNYSIHQIEPIVSLADSKPLRVVSIGTVENPAIAVEFENGIVADMFQCNEYSYYTNVVNKDGSVVRKKTDSDFFGNFVDALIEFFDTGVVPVPHSQTIAVMSIRAAGIKALEKPFAVVECE